MVIRIRSEEHKFTIPLPNALLLSNLVVNIITKVINENGTDISKEDLKLLFDNIKQAKKVLGKNPLVYVKSNDGEEVVITL